MSNNNNSLANMLNDSKNAFEMRQIDFAKAYVKGEKALVDLWLLATGRKECEHKYENVELENILKKEATSEHYITYAYNPYQMNPITLRKEGIEKGSVPYVLGHLASATSGAILYEVVAFVHGEIVRVLLNVDEDVRDDIVQSYTELNACIEKDIEPPYEFTSEQRKIVMLSGMEDLNDTRDDLSEQVSKLQSLIKEIKTLEKEEEELKKSILNEYKDKRFHSATIVVDGRVISLKTIISNRFDSASFKKENPELAEKYIKNTESRRMLIINKK